MREGRVEERFPALVLTAWKILYVPTPLFFHSLGSCSSSPVVVSASLLPELEISTVHARRADVALLSLPRGSSCKAGGVRLEVQE